ncbi:MAG: FHA domain-containing protein [Oscillospiraceae bacterium]|nr:FHA domain-containing protein [Oscillospiraceae bacterium]
MNFTFETRGENTFLSYRVGPDEALDSVSLGMLTNNKIDGLAAMHYTQSDGDVFLKYNVTSKIAVKDFLAGEVNRRRLLGVFAGVADSAASAEEFMLDSSLFILEPEYVFVDVTTFQTSVVCLPVAGRACAVPDLRGFLKNLTINAKYDVEENCDYVAGIINCLNDDEPITPGRLRAVADRLGKRKPAETVSKETAGPPPEQAPDPVAQALADALLPAQGAQGGGEGSVMSLPYLLTHYSRGNKLLYKSGRAGRGRAETPLYAGEAFAIPGEPVQPAKRSQPAAPRTVRPVPVLREARADFGETTALERAAAEETAVLGDGRRAPEGATGGGEPYLIRLGTRERILIDKQVFRIGKERNYVDYCIGDNATVSRSHAYIAARGGKYLLADTNSTNHTYLDGDMIPSGAEYALVHGAHLRLASEEFEFRVEGGTLYDRNGLGN